MWFAFCYPGGDGIVSPPFCLSRAKMALSPLTIAPLYLSSRAQSPSFPLTIAPFFVIPSAVVIISPTIAPFLSSQRSRGICFAPFSSTDFYTSPCIGHAEEPFFQQEWQESHSWQRSGCYRDPRSSAFLSDTGARVEICGRRTAQDRSLDCARDDKGGAVKGKARTKGGERWLGPAVAWADGGLGERWLGADGAAPLVAISLVFGLLWELANVL